MSDIRLDFDTLTSARARVDGAISTFQSAGRVGDDVAALTGEPRLAGKVRDFAGNWDANRAALEEQLAFIRDSLDAVKTYATGDVLLLSEEGMQADELSEQATFADHPALKAGQTHQWGVAAFDYHSQAEQMTRLTDILKESKKVTS